MKWPPWTREISTEHEAPAKGIKGATVRLKADDDKFRHSSEAMKETEQHRLWCDLYETTIAGSIINTEADDLFAQGWAL